jgi:hippurate hydrolase
MNATLWQGVAEEATDWRRHLHAHPEFGFEEHETARFIAARLRAFGLDVHEGIGGTGVVGLLRRGEGTGSICLRADMDALRITEKSNLPHASRNHGTMHACGHDGHTAILLGAARALSHEGGFSGTAVLLFQPAEEHGRGARAMLDDGLLERFPFDEIYGLHNLPGLETGQFATRPGALMASEDNFEIRFTGRGGHAARPHVSNDPIVIAAHLTLALQAIVSRRADPLDNAVVSITEILSDGTRNVLPETVTLKGDTRSFTPAMQALIEREMRQISQGVAAAFGADIEMSYTHEFAPTVNHPAETGHALAAAHAALGAEAVDPDPVPMMGAEDFGLFLQHRPGNFAYLGNGTQGAHGMPLHSAHYDFNDAALAAGIAYFTTLVRQRLGD